MEQQDLINLNPAKSEDKASKLEILCGPVFLIAGALAAGIYVEYTSHNIGYGFIAGALALVAGTSALNFMYDEDNAVTSVD